MEEELKSDLEQSMAEEALAAGAYRKRAEIARLAGDEALAKLYEHVAGEEDTHYKEFSEALMGVMPEGAPMEVKAMAVKFVNEDEGVIEGLLAPFGGPMGGKDLQGEYFDKDTDFCLKWFDTRPCLYQHGLDNDVKTEPVGVFTSLDIKDAGVWAHAQLNKSYAYWEQIKSLIKAGRLFFSSGAVPHLVDRDISGKIKRWPIVEGSLTPTPANPLATIDTFKAMAWLKAVGVPEAALENIKVKEDKLEAKTSAKPEGSPEFKKNESHADPAAAAINGDVKMPAEQPVKTKAPVKAAPPASKTIQLPPEVVKALQALHDSIGQILPGVCTIPSVPPGMDAAGAPPVDPQNTPAQAPTEPGVGQGMAPENHDGGPEAEAPVAEEPIAEVPAEEAPAEATEESAEPPAEEAAEAPAEKPEEEKEPKKALPESHADKVDKDPEPPKSKTKDAETTGRKSAAPDAMKALITDMEVRLKSIVKEAVSPLEERLKGIENTSANRGPIRRVPNAKMDGSPEETPTDSAYKAIMDDPNAPASVKAYIGEKSAAAELSAQMRRGPIPINRGR